MMETIEAEIAILKAEIESAILNDPILCQKVSLLTSIKGVALMTAAVVIAETAGFTLITNKKQLVSYSGYDVVENSSGSRVGKTRISKKGNSHIRRAMHMPALNVVRYGVGNFAQLYERVYAKKGAKMAGYVAVQRKLLMLLHTLWAKDECYDEKFYGTEQMEKSTETILGNSHAEASFGGKEKAEPYKYDSAQDDLFQCKSTLSASFG